MAMPLTHTPTEAIGPPSAGSHDHSTEGFTSRATGIACHVSAAAAPSAPAMARIETSAARTRDAASGTSVLRPREVERAEQCYDQQHAEQLQRHAEGACQRAPQLAQLIAAGDGPRHRAALEDEPHDGCEDRGRQH